MDGCDIYQIGGEVIITLQPSTGYVAVACQRHSELNGYYWWTHRDNRSLADFLLDLDCGYVVGKLFKPDQVEEFDRGQTINNIKSAIIKQRRSGYLTTEKAGGAWDAACGIETADDVRRMREVHHALECIHMRPKFSVAWFWIAVWGSLMAHLREQSKKESKL